MRQLHQDEVGYRDTRLADMEKQNTALLAELKARAPDLDAGAVALAHATEAVRDLTVRLADGYAPTFTNDPRQSPAKWNHGYKKQDVAASANVASVAVSGGAIVEQKGDGSWTAHGTSTSGNARVMIFSGRYDADAGPRPDGTGSAARTIPWDPKKQG